MNQVIAHMIDRAGWIFGLTTLFGLLAVELAVTLTAEGGAAISGTLAVVFFAISLWFVRRSFYGMRIGTLAG